MLIIEHNYVSLQNMEKFWVFKCLTYPDCKCCKKHNILVTRSEVFRISSDLFEIRAKRLEMQVLKNRFICSSATKNNRYSLKDLYLYVGLKFGFLNLKRLFLCSPSYLYLCMKTDLPS